MVSNDAGTGAPPVGGDPERAFLIEAAAEHGIDATGLLISRAALTTSSGPVSALRYGHKSRLHQPARVAFLHGGSQNAHTWDLVAAALGEPAVALDLPGHGSSYWRADHDCSPTPLAEAVTEALLALAPHVDVLVGMSLGGMVALVSAGAIPRLKHLVIVDVSPGSVLPQNTNRAAIAGLVPEDFDTLVANISAMSSHRPAAALAHAVWHNTRPEGARRTWRNDPDMRVSSFDTLWPELERHASKLSAIVATEGSFVPEVDRKRIRRLIGPRLTVAAGATHSVQNTQPRHVAAVVRECVSGAR